MKKPIPPLLKERRRYIREKYDNLLKSDLTEEQYKKWLSRLSRLNRKEMHRVNKLLDAIAFRQFHKNIVLDAIELPDNAIVNLRVITSDLFARSEYSDRNEHPFSRFYDPDEYIEDERAKKFKKGKLQRRILNMLKEFDDEFKFKELHNMFGDDVKKSKLKSTLEKMEEIKSLGKGRYRQI